MGMWQSALERALRMAEHDFRKTNRYREAREASGLSIGGGSAVLKVTPRTLRSWETGRTEPSLSNLKRVSVAYGRSAEWLLGTASRQA